MSPYSIAALALCLIGSSYAQNDAIRDVLEVFHECSNSEGLYPCLKVKALALLDRTSRMEKIEFMNGITFKNNHVDNTKPLVSENEIEATLPRSIDAKSAALSQMIFDKASNLLTSGNLEISLPTLVEEARKKGGSDDKLDKLTSLLEGDSKGKKKRPQKSIKEFLMDVMAVKLGLTPLLLGGLFVLALKALTYAKIAFVISAIIWIKKLLASKGGGGGGSSHGASHSSGHSSGGWSSGGSGGWDAGSSGGGGGWDRRSFNDAQNLAYKAQKQE